MSGVRASSDVEVTLAGERVVLLPERAAWWPAERTLFVSDTHWGKGASMRAHGMPVPSGDLDEQLGRLEAAIVRTGAARVVHLGDLVHAPVGVTPELVERVVRWRARVNAGFVLVRGNHDLRKRGPDLGPTLAQWGIEDAGGALRCGPFVCVHDPAEAVSGVDGFRLGGHIHPAIRVGGTPFDQKLPCFWVRERGMVLPAMSRFTGGVRFEPGASDRLFVVAEGVVVSL